eukprot:3570670-Rhodomonas_salina.1
MPPIGMPPIGMPPIGMPPIPPIGAPYIPCILTRACVDGLACAEITIRRPKRRDTVVGIPSSLHAGTTATVPIPVPNTGKRRWPPYSSVLC